MKLIKLVAGVSAMFMLCACGAAPTVPSTTTNVTPETTVPQSTWPEPDKFIALTFDDGPSADTMNEVLDILAQYDVKATFFIVGRKVKGTAKSVLQRAVDEGHELGSHGMNHVKMAELSEEELLKDIEDCQNVVKDATGVEMKYFRPPFGNVNDQMYDLIQMPFMLASVTCGDGTVGSLAEDRAFKVLSKVYDGAIVLMHCFSGNTATVEALKTIIPELKAQGYGFLTVSELYTYDGGQLPQAGNHVMYRDKFTK